MVCTPNFFVAKIDESHGNLADLYHSVASIHTLNHKFHVDNSLALAVTSKNKWKIQIRIHN